MNSEQQQNGLCIAVLTKAQPLASSSVLNWEGILSSQDWSKPQSHLKMQNT